MSCGSLLWRYISVIIQRWCGILLGGVTFIVWGVTFPLGYGLSFGGGVYVRVVHFAWGKYFLLGYGGFLFEGGLICTEYSCVRKGDYFYLGCSISFWVWSFFWKGRLLEVVFFWMESRISLRNGLSFGGGAIGEGI